MSNLFQSRVDFKPEELEFMITDLKDIMGCLTEKNVLDFSKDQPILLLNRKNTRLQIKKTELREIKRFISLVKASSSLLRHLTRNPTSLTKIEQVIRSDRVMGSINIQKTMANYGHHLNHTKVVCNEIHKSMDTPENFILTQILFSILVFCSRYIYRSGILPSGAHLGSITLDDLNSIRSYTTNLLSTNVIKHLLPKAIDNIGDFDNLFKYDD